MPPKRQKTSNLSQGSINVFTTPDTPAFSRKRAASQSEIGKVKWIQGPVSNTIKRELTLEMLIFHGYAEEDIFEVTNPNTYMRTKSKICIGWFSSSSCLGGIKWERLAMLQFKGVF
jgi:hypothetical protein